jgi:hypothetical protein
MKRRHSLAGATVLMLFTSVAAAEVLRAGDTGSAAATLRALPVSP